MNVMESGLGRGVHFVIGLAVLSVGYAGVLLAVKFLIVAAA
jgi:hypothetical protein